MIHNVIEMVSPLRVRSSGGNWVMGHDSEGQIKAHLQSAHWISRDWISYRECELVHCEPSVLCFPSCSLSCRLTALIHLQHMMSSCCGICSKALSRPVMLSALVRKASVLVGSSYHREAELVNFLRLSDG